MINNRQQSGRRRGRGGQRQGGAPGQGGGNRIDNRARGNASQLYEKYKNLASDAQRQGDRVQAEYYLQFADHYYRVLAETRPRFEEQQRQARARDEGYDDDGEGAEIEAVEGEEYADEGEAIRPGEQMTRPDRDRGPRRFEERRPRDGEDRRDTRRDGERQRDERPREDRQRDDRGERRFRREERVVNGEARGEIAERASLPVEAETPVAVPAESEVPRRRGRPRKQPEQEAAEPARFDADLLPPAISQPANDADVPDAKPRRRRARAVDPAEASAAE